MKVKELIEALQKYDPEMSVRIHADHGECAENAWNIDKYCVCDDGELATMKDLQDDEWTQEEINASFEECVVIFS
jgi:hypothetical protein